MIRGIILKFPRVFTKIHRHIHCRTPFTCIAVLLFCNLLIHARFHNRRSILIRGRNIRPIPRKIRPGVQGQKIVRIVRQDYPRKCGVQDMIILADGARGIAMRNARSGKRSEAVSMPSTSIRTSSILQISRPTSKVLTASPFMPTCCLESTPSGLLSDVLGSP